MTQERIVRSLLVGGALVLVCGGCVPEPLDHDADAGSGATGGAGMGAGGSATGGTASVPVCDTVESLPTMGTSCATEGESLCDPRGGRCVCARGLWYCNTSCASTYPTQPTPCSDCIRGAACNYPPGGSCVCVNWKWMCIDPGACPANVPQTGDACNGLTGLWCDYPDPNPALHVTQHCEPEPYSTTDSIWGGFQSAPCPATQPAYSLTSACPGIAFCSYGSVRCTCMQQGSPWTCGLGMLTLLPSATPYQPCAYVVDVAGSDGKLYRGRVHVYTSIASNADAGCVAKLDFSGSEIEFSDGRCRQVEPNNSLDVQIFIGTGDTSLDAAGTLHVHIAPRNGYYASGPNPYTNTSATVGWTVDLTLTADGQLAATVSAPVSSDQLTMSGPVESSCVVGSDGGPAPSTIPVSGGGTFSFPCRARGAC